MTTWVAVILFVERTRNPVRSLAALLAALSAPACATILDFQDPVDAPADASTTLGADASVAADASTSSGETSVDVASTLAVPAGWRGPLRLQETTGSPAPCDGDFPELDYDGHAGPRGAAASCSCACGAPSGVTCAAPSAELYTDGACGAVCATGTTVIGCARPTCAGSVGSVRVSASAVGGSCAGSASSQISPPTWSTQVRLCGGGKGNGNGNSCIAKRGAASCPAAFPSAHTAYGAFADTRTCSACTCGAPTGASCTGSVASYATGSCSPATSTAAFDTCVPYDAKARITATSAASATGGACAPSGGAPTGTVIGDDPTTICCRF